MLGSLPILKNDLHQQWGGVPSAVTPFVLVQLAKSQKKPLFCVAPSQELATLWADQIAYLQPELPLMLFPEWDTVPYDRVSPDKSRMSARVSALTAIAPKILLTTPRALFQKTIPKTTFFPIHSLDLKIGDPFSMTHFKDFARQGGYTGVDTVREVGEYTIRGGVVDIFSAATTHPLRVDLFGDSIENMRLFDPLSQRTIESTDHARLMPLTEVVWSSSALTTFRYRYIQLFGTQAGRDPFLHEIEEGMRPLGVEHWLPLFYDHLDPLWDRLQEGIWVIPHDLQLIYDTLWDQAQDHYTGRLEAVSHDQPYRPVPVSEFYVTPDQWTSFWESAYTLTLSPFDISPSLHAKRFPVTFQNNETPSQWLSRFLGHTPDHVILTAMTLGAKNKITNLLSHYENTLPLKDALSWQDVESMASKKVALVVAPFTESFTWGRWTLIAQNDLFGERLTSRRPARKEVKLDLGAFEAGDYLVHQDHGIGKFLGIINLDVNGIVHECLTLVYAQNAKLYVPVENLDLLSKYTSGHADIPLDQLGAPHWQKRKASVKKRIQDIAAALLKTAACRMVEKGVPIEASQPEIFEAFCNTFPYVETDDQLRAISDVIEDLGRERPMDRLVCGDVGFGKTEVAMRAAFMTALAGLQVVVVTPTTILCRQHFQTFSQRFHPFGIRVSFLSRMMTSAHERLTRKGLEEGSIQVIITTHAVFSKTLKFRGVGLVILDEEQHFGVRQKEALKQLHPGIHILSMSATPIPRTLQMAVSGIRDLSLISTPPLDRLAVKPFVMPFDSLLIKEAILREHHRGGQVYVVCPRIKDLSDLEIKLKDLVPHISMAIAHGGMAPQELDQRMQDFYEKKFTLLLATNIVESGLDVPSANTLIVYRADMFGLAQLYQLRGRIGRGKVRGYAYFLVPPDRMLNDQAMRRLEVIQSLDKLGAGFMVASSDMDIRGTGNLVGEEQSGHIKEVGLELYQTMLQEAIEVMRYGETEGTIRSSSHFSPQINLGAPVLLPETYVPDLSVRLSLYRRLASLTTFDEIMDFEGEIVDRFGDLPPEAKTLLDVMRLKLLAIRAWIERIEAGPKGVIFKFHQDQVPYLDSLLNYIQERIGLFKLRPDQSLVLLRSWGDVPHRLEGIGHVLKELSNLNQEKTVIN